MELMLPYTLHSKYRKWGWLWREPIEASVLIVLYACLKALKDAQHNLPHNYLHSVAFVDNSHIAVIRCEELHKWKSNILVRLMMEME